MAPTFASECAPKEVRGRITGLFQIMVTSGVMLSYWINRESSSLGCFFLSLSAKSDFMVVQWEHPCISVTRRRCGGSHWPSNLFQQD